MSEHTGPRPAGRLPAGPHPAGRAAPGGAWHAGPRLLERYAAGALGPAVAASVEAHVAACGRCRARCVGLVPPARLEVGWAGVAAALDAPRPGPVERLLLALRVPDDVARLLAATPSLSVSWLAAVALALASGVGAAHAAADGIVVFLAVAPLLPVLGVAVAYGPGVDPVHEIAVAAPTSGLRLLLVRAVAVLASTVVLAAAAALALPGLGWAAAWLLPALGLTGVTLALSARVAASLAAGVVVGIWALALVLGGTLGEDPRVLFGPGAQAVHAAVAVAAAAVVVVVRDRFEEGRLAGGAGEAGGLPGGPLRRRAVVDDWTAAGPPPGGPPRGGRSGGGTR